MASRMINIASTAGNSSPSSSSSSNEFTTPFRLPETPNTIYTWGEGGNSSNSRVVRAGALSDPFIAGSGVEADGLSGQRLSATATSFTPAVPGGLQDAGSHKNAITDLDQISLGAACVVDGSTSISQTAITLRARPIKGSLVLHYRPDMLMVEDPLFAEFDLTERRRPNTPDFVLNKSIPDKLHVDFYEVDKLRVYAQHIHLRYPNWKQDDDPLLPRLSFRVVVADGDPSLLFVKLAFQGPDEVVDFGHLIDQASPTLYTIFQGFGSVLEWPLVHLNESASVGFKLRYRDPADAATAARTMDGLDTVLCTDRHRRAGADAPIGTPPLVIIHFRQLLPGNFEAVDSQMARFMENLRLSFFTPHLSPTQGPASPFSVQWDSVNTGTRAKLIGEPVAALPAHPIGLGGSTGVAACALHTDQYHESPSLPSVVRPSVDQGVVARDRSRNGSTLIDPVRTSPGCRAMSGYGNRRTDASNASHNHNVVDTDCISRGVDVRTTIMLRNIPNKVNQPMLKAIVDETSHGKYDFMYLRIDFANDCNVGYAFINFEDPYHIIDFVRTRAGFRWNCFNSDKVAEVSYATIQGKDCLIQKFRNSSVMLENPLYRPKVFHTGTDSLAGTEDEFPGPDNNSKMRRSIENAAHIGLFTPGGGQNPRHDQRRRRSQYDRGTRLAILEEAHGYPLPGMGRLTLPNQGPSYPGYHTFQAVAEERSSGNLNGNVGTPFLDLPIRLSGRPSYAGR